jgi:hypothetical protein
VKAFLALVRYVLALLLTTQRWAPPSIVLIGLIAWIWVTPPIAVDTLRITMLALFALAAWLGHATGTAEDPSQELISVSCGGSATRGLCARWFVAAVLAASFPLLMLVGVHVYDLTHASQAPIFTDAQATSAALALAGIAAAGAALGMLVASVLRGRPGWAAAILILISLAQAAPLMLPVPALASALPLADQPIGWGLFLGVLLAALLTLALLATTRVVHDPAR